MSKSEVKVVNGIPKLFVNEAEVPSCAYTTYFDERNRYEDFTKAGYDLYSVTVAFASRALNAFTGFTPYEKGIFDDVEGPDFSLLDNAVNKVLKVNPNACIFPRIHMTMPEWWCEKYPDETIVSPCGEVRELLFSEQFRKDGSEMLKQLIAHVEASSYSENIIGYHLADGCTEEWFHYGRQGGQCKNAEKYFYDFLDKNYPQESLPHKLPDLNGIYVEGEIKDPLLKRYLEFSNVSVADTIAHFAQTVKTVTNRTKTVGTFYGYVTEICSPLPGDIALDRIINCPDIDFFCSPNSYVETRALGIDWGDSLPFASLRKHGKIYFSECDIRTSLSDYINNCRPGADKNNKYYGDIWLGPKTVKGSVSAMRKAYAHQLSRRNSLWWFDMWGGWYDHPKYMAEAKRCLKLFGSLNPDAYGYKPELAVFADGELYQRQGCSHPSYRAQSAIRNALGISGIPYDLYLLSDFESVVNNYKAVIFPVAVSSPGLEKAVKFCEKKGIPYLRASLDKWEYSPEELREFAKPAKIHIFSTQNDVVYAGCSLLAIHSATAGKKEIKLPEKALVKNVCSNQKPFISDKITLELKKHETIIFALKDI